MTSKLAISIHPQLFLRFRSNTSVMTITRKDVPEASTGFIFFNKPKNLAIRPFFCFARLLFRFLLQAGFAWGGHFKWALLFCGMTADRNYLRSNYKIINVWKFWIRPCSGLSRLIRGIQLCYKYSGRVSSSW